MSGIVGRLLHEFAVTICAAILVSGVVSLTLTPMLCSRFLKRDSVPHEEELEALARSGRHSALSRGGRLGDWFEAGYQAGFSLYRRTLKVVMGHRLATVIVSGVLLIATVFLFGLVPKGFIPSDDTGQISAITEAAQGTSFVAMVKHQQMLAAVVARDPNVQEFISSVGQGGGVSGSNQGRFIIHLKPRGQRLGADDVVRELGRARRRWRPGCAASRSWRTSPATCRSPTRRRR
jgi:HAE1 family hydrophobic/amphiphilic exporter-1